MQADILETLSQLTETTLENYRKLGETSLKLGEKLLQEQTELTAALIEAAKGKAEKASGAKDYSSLASSQAELAQECGQLVMNSCKSCAEILADGGKFISQLFEAGIKTANSNVGAKTKGRKSA